MRPSTEPAKAPGPPGTFTAEGRRIAPLRDAGTFNPKSLDSISSHALSLRGATIRDVVAHLEAHDLVNGEDRRRTKGDVGLLVERYFGLKQANDSSPDLSEAGVEIKTIPVKISRGRRVAKEPTSIKMIDYSAISKEEWDTASVRPKLQTILFVPWEVAPSYDDCQFLRPFIWSPTRMDWNVFERDWHGIQTRILAGEAHILSERHSLALAARRKGSSGETRQQPFSSIVAPSRAFALKTTFTNQLLEEFSFKQKFESLAKGMAHLDADWESEVIHHLKRFDGQTLASVQVALGIQGAPGKSLASSIVRRALGLTKLNAKIAEFERHGVELKVLNINPVTGRLNESVSFPAFSFAEFARENWEGSDLMNLVDRICFVPTYGERAVSQHRRALGKPFFWSPTDEQWTTIEAEWRQYQGDIIDGKAAYSNVPTATGGSRRANALKSESETRIIHIRPHAANAADTDLDPQGNPVTRQSFWLNKAFVAELVKHHASTT